MTQLTIDMTSIQAIKNIDFKQTEVLLVHCGHLRQGHGNKRAAVLNEASLCHKDESSVRGVQYLSFWKLLISCLLIPWDLAWWTPSSVSHRSMRKRENKRKKKCNGKLRKSNTNLICDKKKTPKILIFLISILFTYNPAIAPLPWSPLPQFLILFLLPFSPRGCSPQSGLALPWGLKSLEG